MLKTSEIDIRALLDELEEPLIHVGDVAVDDVLAQDEPDDDFDGLCALHDGCRTIG